MVQVISRVKAFLWRVQVCVGIDSPRNHQLTVGIHRLHPSWDDQVLTNLPDGGGDRRSLEELSDPIRQDVTVTEENILLDDPILDVYVSIKWLVIINDLTPFDDQSVSLEKQPERMLAKLQCAHTESPRCCHYIYFYEESLEVNAMKMQWDIANKLQKHQVML